MPSSGLGKQLHIGAQTIRDTKAYIDLKLHIKKKCQEQTWEAGVAHTTQQPLAEELKTDHGW